MLLTNATVEEVKAVPSIPVCPRQKEIIPHRVLIEAILDLSEDRGWEAINPQIHLSEDRQYLTACFDLIRPHQSPPPGCVWSVGMINDNRNRVAMNFVAGVRVAEEEAPVLLTEIPLGKHTATNAIRLPYLCHLAFVEYSRQSKHYASTVEELRRARLTPLEVDDLLTTLARARYLPWSRIGAVDRLYREGPQTAWNLLLCLTRVRLRSSPLRFHQHLYAFTQMIISILRNKQITQKKEQE